MGKTTREKPKNEIATCTYDCAIQVYICITAVCMVITVTMHAIVACAQPAYKVNHNVYIICSISYTVTCASVLTHGSKSSVCNNPHFLHT